MERIPICQEEVCVCACARETELLTYEGVNCCCFNTFGVLRTVLDISKKGQKAI